MKSLFERWVQKLSTALRYEAVSTITFKIGNLGRIAPIENVSGISFQKYRLSPSYRNDIMEKVKMQKTGFQF